MRLANYSGEESISILLINLYEIKERHKSRAREFEHHVRRANPHVDFENLAGTRLGSQLFVPEIPGLEPKRHTRPVRHGGLALLLQMRIVVTSFRTAAMASVEFSVAEARKTLDRIKSKEVKAHAKKVPSFAECLPSITESAKEKIRNAGQLKTAHQRTFDNLGKDLDRLIERLSQS